MVSVCGIEDTRFGDIFINLALFGFCRPFARDPSDSGCLATLAPTPYPQPWTVRGHLHAQSTSERLGFSPLKDDPHAAVVVVASMSLFFILSPWHFSSQISA